MRCGFSLLPARSYVPYKLFLIHNFTLPCSLQKQVVSTEPFISSLLTTLSECNDMTEADAILGQNIYNFLGYGKEKKKLSWENSPCLADDWDLNQGMYRSCHRGKIIIKTILLFSCALSSSSCNSIQVDILECTMCWDRYSIRYRWAPEKLLFQISIQNICAS